MATRDHRSQLLITTRERPPKLTHLEGDTPLVRSLQLDGLDVEAGRALLADRGLSGTVGQAGELIRRYSGNPLALKLVTETVDEMYFGDVDEFLGDETLVFDDIRLVLHQQFARATQLEQEILFWMAVNREPMSMPEIRANLLQMPPQRKLIEALRNLQRRSLIERNELGFGLQNVIIEYLTNHLVETAHAELDSGELHVLHRQALLMAQTQEYVRQSQVRLILDPLAQALTAAHQPRQLAAHLQTVVAHLRETAPGKISYAAGNLLNLLLHLGLDITGYDFSHLAIRQAYLQGATLQSVDFTGADFSRSVFNDTFGDVQALAIHPAGDTLAAATADGEIRLWRLADRQLQAIMTDDCGPISTVAFSPDGEIIVGGSTDYKVRMWDVQTAQLLRILGGHARCGLVGGR